MITQEDKELLLQDLCSRLPYGVIVSPIDCGKAKLIGFKDDHPILFDLVSQKEYDKSWEIEYVRPYLRSLSSITVEEFKEWLGYCKADYDCEFQPEPTFNFESCILSINWLNKNHFDYRDLIPKGIAIAVTKENNPYK